MKKYRIILLTVIMTFLSVSVTAQPAEALFVYQYGEVQPSITSLLKDVQRITFPYNEDMAVKSFTNITETTFAIEDVSKATIEPLETPEIYIITATADANGIITPIGEITVNHGDNQTFIFVANAGYEINQLLVDNIHTPEAAIAGTYTFENITDNHTIHVTFKETVSIVETQCIASLQVYPNPTDGDIYIGYSMSDMQYKTFDVEIFNVFGKSVTHLTSEIENRKIAHRISIAHLPAGIYFLRITTDNETVTKRVLKQ